MALMAHNSERFCQIQLSLFLISKSPQFIYDYDHSSCQHRIADYTSSDVLTQTQHAYGVLYDISGIFS